jgi:hypothetical protein
LSCGFASDSVISWTLHAEASRRGEFQESGWSGISEFAGQELFLIQARGIIMGLCRSGVRYGI